MDFSDRFTILYTGLDLATLDTIPEAQFQSNFSELANFVAIVKRHSVLLKNKTRSEIYSAIVDHADPKIGLILAAARDRNTGQIFPSTAIVKEFMFGVTTTEQQPSYVQFNERAVFMDGIKRVSCALAASLLIGQLAQVPEQQTHSVYLEGQALADLDRILQVPELVGAIPTTDDTRNQDDVNIRSFYFTPGNYPINVPVTLEVFISGSPAWIQVATYTDNINTAQVAADLADNVNTLTLTSSTSNLVAAPVLAAEFNLHRVDFNSRKRDLTISTELISIRFVSTNTSFFKTPFTWGIDTRDLKEYTYNSLILTVLLGRISTIADSSATDNANLNVLYFRTIDGAPVGVSTFTYRISPTMDADTTVTFVNTAQGREADISTALLNDLFETKSANRVLAGIVQNDPNTATTVYSGIYLVAYTVSTAITEYILDLMTIPSDIEVALGNRLGPITSFSNKPRSITVPTIYDSELARSGNAPLLEEEKAAGIGLVEAKPASIVQKIKDIREEQYISYLPKQGYPLPPEVYSPYDSPKRTL